MLEPVRTLNHRGLTIRFYHDQDCASPRENDNLGTMVCGHRRYKLGDKQLLSDDTAGWIAQLRQDMLDDPDGHVALVLWLIDHSGLAMRWTDFNPQEEPSHRYGRNPFPEDYGGWDSGIVGIIYADRHTIEKEYSISNIGDSTITTEVRDKVRQCLIAEVEEYSRWLSGECYGYSITPEDDPDTDLDSCWGFIGFEFAKESAIEQADYYADRRQQKQTIAQIGGL